MFRICSQLLASIDFDPMTRRHRQSGFHIAPCRSVVALHGPSTDRSPRAMGRPHDAIVPRQLRHLFADLDFAVSCAFWAFCLLRNLGRRRQQWRKSAPGVLFCCGNAPSCGSAAVFDSILVQGTVEHKCLCVSLLFALHTHAHPCCWVFMLKACGCNL